MLMSRLGVKPEGLVSQQLSDLIPTASLLAGDTFLPALERTAKSYGLRIHALVGDNGRAQRMRITIYEVSFCNAFAACGTPSIGAQPGPFLAFVLEGARSDSDLAAGVTDFDDGPRKAVPYIASDWLPSQL
jgi:hypothetical protein